MSKAREYKTREREAYRQIKRARWAKKSLAEKLASIWIIGFFSIVVIGIGGFLIGMFVWVEFDLGFRACLPMNIGIALVLITWLALMVDGNL
jgi:hypothetical protein